jgi:hypothetical protein
MLSADVTTASEQFNTRRGYDVRQEVLFCLTRAGASLTSY